jgi:hypothetical protein
LRLIETCRRIGATVYRTGPRGLDYLDIKQFKTAGIQIEVIEYGDYYPYQSGPSADAEPVSVLENLAILGQSVTSQLKHEFREVKFQ